MKNGDQKDFIENCKKNLKMVTKPYYKKITPQENKNLKNLIMQKTLLQIITLKKIITKEDETKKNSNLKL